jgi:RNA 2',3'-cyclic 3'-phosphodiesterase
LQNLGEGFIITSMRLFIALEIPGDVKNILAAVQPDLRQAHAEVGWTKVENLHLTLKFLGEVEAAHTNTIMQACVETASQHCGFRLALNGLGFFPNVRHPRVIWAGLKDDSSELQALHKSLEEKFYTLGFTRKEKPFNPHLTLGRIKTAKNVRQLVSRTEAYQLPVLSFTIAELVLMQSQLQPGGSIYTPLVRARLSAT